MHAVHGTIGHDPAATAAAEGRDLYAPTSKQESRERWFEARRAAFAQAAGHLGRKYTSDGNQGVVKFNQAPPRPSLGEERKFVARWTNAKGQAWRCGIASGGLSPEATVKLLAILFRNGVTVVNVEAVA